MKRRTILFFFIASAIQCLAQTFESEIEAAEAGDANSQYYIGSFYENGTGGVEQRNDSLAFIWYQKAAEMGKLEAQEKIAEFYLNGKGVEQNSRKAFELYQRLAELGRAGSMDKLANRYELGDGVAKDIYQARDWYIKAIKSGSSNAKGHLDALYKRYPNIIDTIPSPQPEPIPATPLLKVNRYELAATREYEKTLQKAYPFILKVYLTNANEGIADDVTVDIKLPDGALMVGGKDTHTFTTINGKETIDILYRIMVLDNYPAVTIPIDIKIKEKTGKYAEDWHADIPIGQRLPYPDISDIDIDIPVTSETQPNTYALIVSEENYKNDIEPVPFAINDGSLFKEYCIKTLGLPNENIIFLKDITKSEFSVSIEQLKNLVSLNNHPENTKVLFYYAGHGIPNEKKRTANLLPNDGYGNNPATWIDLDIIYQQLGKIGSQSVSVFLDACFSGQKRDGGSINKDRGVMIKPRPNVPTKDMVVFAAAQNDETAYSYQDKQHGMFTYYLLKKLKDTQGEATLGELSQYVKREVAKTSILINKKEQTPTTDSSITGWEKMKLK